MPDDTVISGSEWGNILVWKDGYIKVEIGRMLNKKCHDAPITQFMYKEHELWSISMDGHIKIWHYKSIENKKFLENRFIAVEPICEFFQPQIMFMGIHKVTTDYQDTSYFVQDGNGGIWNIDLNTKTNPKPPIQLYKCHGGAIVDIAACPWGCYLASLGSDGRLQLYQYVKKKLVLSHHYPAKGTCMIWLSLHESSDHMIIGFDDGNLRVVVLTFNGENITATTTQVIKSHTGPITNVEICKNKRKGVSSSDDATIFIYSLENIENYINLIPIGFVPVAICISYLKWHLHQDATIVMGSTNGCYFELPVSDQVHPCTEDSYMLQEKPSSNSLIFENSTLRNRILWFIFVEIDIMWLSMDGSDSGFIYEHNKSENTCELIYSANGVAINNCIMNERKTYIVLTMSDGNITVTKTNPNNMRDFSISWELSLHTSNSFYSQTCFSKDENYLFTSWQDGNIFSYKVNINQEPLKFISICSNQHQYPKEVEDSNGYTNLSLEELKIKIKNDLKSMVANQNKQTLEQKLKILRTQFEDLLKRNNALPLSQIIPKEELEIHPLITQYFKEQQQVSLAYVNEGLARALEKSRITLKKVRARFIDSLDCFPITVTAICNKSVAKTVAQRKLIEKFDDTLILVEEKIKNESQIAERMERVKFFDEIVTVDNPLTGMHKRTKEKKDVLFKLPPGDQNFGPKLNQLLDHYNIHKLNLKKRKQEWEEFTAMKPLKVNCVEDQIELCQAIGTVGDYKLKSDQNYKVPKSLYTTVAKKYHCLLQVSLKKYNIIHEYNIEVYQLRESRVKVLKYLHHLLSNLRDVQEELEEKDRKVVPNIPNTTMEDFPETNLEVVVALPENDKRDANVKIIKPSKGDFLEKEILIDDEEDSEWELEARHHRKARKLFQQNLLLSKIHKNIQQFDDAVNQLAKENCTIMQQINLLDLHIISLNQELIVLKKFEKTEKEINAKMYSKVEKLYEIQNSTQITTGFIYEHIANANQLLEENRNVKRQFLLAIMGNTHSSYFKMIFNSNATTTNEEMFENSSDESDGSVDTTLTDIDSTVVCNSELYKVTLEFKAKKLHINERLKHLKDVIDKLNGDLQLNSTRNTRLKREIEALECQMEQVQKEKQDQLNEVMCTIILKLDQLQHLKSASTASKIGETLVFSQSTLTNLYKRVGQLHQDTVQQEIKHKECISHICRMKTDFHQMKEDIKKLEQDTNAAINKKVGMVIPMDLIEEVRLRDKLFKFNLSQANVKASYRQQLVALNEAVKLKQIELRNITKENTARLNMLAEISCEKTNLIQTIRKQSAKKKHLENVVSIAEQCKENIEKLSNIIKKQNQDIEILRNEIKRLSFKSLPLVDRKISDDILNLNLDIDKPSSEIYQWKPSEELSKTIDLPCQQHFTAQVQIPLV
ncbi:hypothetical protein RI129_007320 [Pyrocoelia pectoralis]|uniref:WD repeat-containing protein 52 n=1 Tax=Pyrocoelia pectoralis TaxID=417401 RepID=A0AAN7ZET0_9COLE